MVGVCVVGVCGRGVCIMTDMRGRRGDVLQEGGVW